jgi:RHS repeat-associated protein
MGLETQYDLRCGQSGRPPDSYGTTGGDARHTHGSHVDEPLSEIQSGTIGYYEQDGIGSSTSLSNSAGALANTYSYDSFGKLTASTGTLTNPFRYTAREFDSETGIYFYRARYFDPGTGRFITEDPIGLGGGTNFYEYARNNPVLLIDPLGLKWTNTGVPAPPNTNTILQWSWWHKRSNWNRQRPAVSALPLYMSLGT